MPSASLPSSAKRLVRVALAAGLMLGAIAYLCNAMRPEVEVLRRSLGDIHWGWVGVAMLAAMPIYVLKGCYQLHLLDRLTGSRTSRRDALPVYLQSQLVRYLPGKIWGLVYQSQRMAGTHRTSEVVIANIWQMGITNLLAIGVVLSVMLGLLVSPAWFALLVPVILVIEWLHRHPAIESWGLRLLARVLPSLAPIAARESLPPMPLKGTSILCGEWAFHLLAFFALLHGKAGWTEMLLLGTWYAGASILALAAFVVPAGLAVREAVFVAVPDVVGVDVATLIVVAALARMTFLGAELGAAAVSSLVASRRA